MLTLTTEQILARCEEFMRAHPRYKMQSGPFSAGALTRPWSWDPTDCSSFATWAVGCEKFEDHPGNANDIWWGTGNIYADATGKQRRWGHLGSPVGRGSGYDGLPAHVGAIVVYPGHCGVVVGGTFSRPETVESASSKNGAWRGKRSTGFWSRKGAVFCVPRSEI